MKPKSFSVEGHGLDEAGHPFTSVGPEAVSRAQVADRILSRVLADLTAMREIVVRAASASMRDEARATAQRDVENLKGDIARLTEMLSRFSVDELGVTAAEYAESMALIDRSIEEATDVVEKFRTARSANAEPRAAEEEALSKWFDRVTKGSDPADDERSFPHQIP